MYAGGDREEEDEDEVDEDPFSPEAAVAAVGVSYGTATGLHNCKTNSYRRLSVQFTAPHCPNKM